MSASRRKGTAWESALVGYLREHGWPSAERRALSGRQDRGDVAGLPGWVLEAKDQARLELGAFVDEARVEAGNAGARWYAAVVKRRRRGVADAYVVLPLSVFVDLLAEGGHR